MEEPMFFSDYLSRRPRLLSEDIFPIPRSLQHAIDNMLLDVNQPSWLSSATTTFSPFVDVDEDEKQVRVIAELPGLKESDIEVVYQPGAILLRGEKKEEEHREAARGKGRYEERRYGAFERRIPLAAEVDEKQIQASFDRGVLTVVIPKTAEVQAQARKIQVKSGPLQIEQQQSRPARGQQSSEGAAASH
jgi:HSP20 family protein